MLKKFRCNLKKVHKLIIVNLLFLVLTSVCNFNPCFVNSKSSFFAVNPNDSGDYLNYYQRIEMDKAWELCTGYSDVKIGLIDSGINGSSLDFLPNVNSLLSHDFYDSTRSPISNPSYHGPLVANRMAAIGDNNYGTAGVIWNLDLISLRIDGLDGNEDFDALVDAINYATYHNIPILNFSGGFYELDLTSDQISELYDAILDYPGLFVCAAGNEQLDLDSQQHKLYPACFNLDNILCVGATNDYSDTLSTATNCGAISVDLFAPGSNGTSLAAPLVAGTAGLMLSVRPSLTTAELKSALLNNVDIIDDLSDLCVSGGRLNVYKSVKSVLPWLSPNTNYSLRKISYLETHWYRINITNGIYTIETAGNLDTEGSLYLNTEGNALISSSTGGSNNNFSFEYHISTTMVYYLKITCYTQNANSYYQIILTNHNHQYDYNYAPNGPLNHMCLCICGDYILSPHIFRIQYEFGADPCIICGYSLGGILNVDDLESIGIDSYLDSYGNIILGESDYLLSTYNE